MLNSPRAYGIGAPTIGLAPIPIPLNRNPATSDIDFPIGQLVVNESTNTIWGLTSKSAGLANWAALGSGTTGAVTTITGGSGGALSPTLGNINILGTASQITSAGAGSTITLSIPAAFIAPGSIVATTTVASTTTMVAGTGFTATTGNIVASAGNISATLGSITAGTTVTGTTGLVATSGNITATNGNVVLTAAGNKINRGSVATTTAAGANSAGTVTLVGGTATVSTTSVTTNSLIRISRMSVGATGAAALGELSVGTIVNGTSFVINAWQAANATALQASDVSSIYWEITN